MTPSARDILERLIAFPTVSRDPNRALIDYVADLLAAHGVEATVIPDAHGGKANLYATVGPTDRGGVLLSGHTDVVPVDGQAWTKPPFKLTEADGRLYGRGTADMKGFVACAVAAVCAAAGRKLATPLHLALSYDEEVGCLGVHSLIDMLAAAPVKPAMCIVGEPTSMGVASGHKGKIALRAVARGEEGHSALAPLAFNALHLAADFVTLVRAKQAEIAEGGARDGDYDVPYTTLHVGKLAGGVALNIVPNEAVIHWEIRNLAEDDPAAILADLRARADALVAAAGHPAAGIDWEEVFSYPGLGTAPDAAVMDLLRRLTGSNAPMKVAFGTEGGLFSARLGIPTAICGPGSMLQGHKPDEFVSVAQFEACEAMLGRLVGMCEASL